MFEDNQSCCSDYGVKKLISTLVYISFKDLTNFVEDPIGTSVYLRRFGETPQSIVDFWKRHAYVFLCFLYGSAKAQKVVKQAITPLIKCAENTLNDKHKKEKTKLKEAV